MVAFQRPRRNENIDRVFQVTMLSDDSRLSSYFVHECIMEVDRDMSISLRIQPVSRSAGRRNLSAPGYLVGRDQAGLDSQILRY
jgi:hypothetical protein